MSELNSNYGLNLEGGRVKSAGLSANHIFEIGDTYIEDPGPQTAQEVTAKFRTLRDNPPLAFRTRFFPLDRAEIKPLMKTAPTLYRPSLKTDQGPGLFTPFHISDEDRPMHFQVHQEEGYIIPEGYFQRQLDVINDPVLNAHLDEVRQKYQTGALNEAYAAFQQLKETSEEKGLTFHRPDTQVGRNALFFIHPAQMVERVEIGSRTSDKVEEEVNSVISILNSYADYYKRQFAQENGLPYRKQDENSEAFYLQADVQILPSGEAIVSELQVPDVGLFLTDLDPHNNSVIAEVQKIVEPMRDTVVDGFEEKIRTVYTEKGPVPVFLVTRSEVVCKDEDVLEQKELSVIQKSLLERGIGTEVISADQAAEFDENSLMFIFNLDPSSDEFHRLASSYLKDTKGKKIMTPEPFMLMAQKMVTGYQTSNLDAKKLSRLEALTYSGENDPNKLYTQLMAVDNYLTKAGMYEDVIHFCHQSLPTPIPIYRYDIKSMQIALSMINRLGIKEVSARSIPISDSRAVMFDQDGGVLYSTFRFMFTKK